MRYAYLVPAGLLLLGILAIPLLVGLASGASELGQVFEDTDFGKAALTTLWFAVATVVLELILGLLFALLLHQTFRLRGLARALALVPWALPTAVMAMSWKWIFDPTAGVVNNLLGTSITWLAQPQPAFWAIVIADVWKTTPFVMIILLAGLQSIPRDLYEALNIDGGGPVRRFFWVTLPLLRPAIALALTFRLIHAFGIFDLVYVMTGGQADTETLALFIYKVIVKFDDPARGAALTLVTAAGIFLFAVVAGALARGRARA
ncbi:MAG: sugar ABC transporter permease [Planctomycetes bacterium]|nr:sugar ABC transporter permease [Planctomycetota bacterium]